ncbi:hypothetical protein HNW13_017770 [Shewanella sp. BF02_Schw]|uniref:hypothetical protein n=1 Tax=Shewanella sp. BF02_Schw TaxID=394908 RepID=UPI0017815D0E|nr:hypothetical protein [Shewanella sp. BF02_Schw]MBO1897588.1 hypothetical protein [Shewanella sp. BF02_Schw]
MIRFNTQDIAEIMLKEGGYYTAASLAILLDISSKKASWYLFNVRTSRKYKTIDTGLPLRKVKVISIDGRRLTKTDLWKIALGKKQVN